MSDGGLISLLNPLLMTVIVIPRQLYLLYVDYLWKPPPNSYVSKVASSMYILAIMMITPFVLLTLLVFSIISKVYSDEEITKFHLGHLGRNVICDCSYSWSC